MTVDGVCELLITFEVNVIRPAKFEGLRAVAYRGGVWGVQPPVPEILKALQNRAKLNPIVKTVKNC